MPVIEGSVRFRNRMGNTAFVKIRQVNGGIVHLWLRQEILGDAFAPAAGAEIASILRVEVDEAVQRPMFRQDSPVEMVHPVLQVLPSDP